jgi:chaperone BCS1
MEFPILKVIERLVYRVQPGTSLEALLALVALYQAGMPVYAYLKSFFKDTFTSEVTIRV